MADIPVVPDTSYNMAGVGIASPVGVVGPNPIGVGVASPPPMQETPHLLGNLEQLASNPLARYGLNEVQQRIGRWDMGFIKSWHHMLRYYFSVNNSYVLNKLKIVMFPFLHKQWSRRIVRDADGNSYLPPSQDVNAPDLYIPSMAFITYILVVAFFMGTTFRFTPEVLGLTASTGLFVLFIEILIIKLGLYIFNFPTIPLLDLTAYCGYKFVGVTQIMLVGIFLGSVAYYIVFAMHALFMGSFMVKTLRLLLPKQLDDQSGSTYLRSYFLMFVALLQGAVAFFLCYLDFKYGDTSSPA